MLAALDEAPPSLADVWYYTDKLKMFVNLIILTVAFVGGIAATLSALNIMANSELSRPCYAGFFSSSSYEVSSQLNVSPTVVHFGKVNCCGPFRNISVLGNLDYCLDPSIILSSGSHG